MLVRLIASRSLVQSNLRNQIPGITIKQEIDHLDYIQAHLPFVSSFETGQRRWLVTGSKLCNAKFSRVQIESVLRDYEKAF